MNLCKRPGCENAARKIYCSKKCLDKVRNDYRSKNGTRSNTTLSNRVAEDQRARAITIAFSSWKVVEEESTETEDDIQSLPK